LTTPHHTTPAQPKLTEPAAIMKPTLEAALGQLSVPENLDEAVFRELLLANPLSWSDPEVLLQLYRSLQDRPGPTTLSAFLLGANLWVDGKIGSAEHVRRGFLDGKPVVVKFAKAGLKTVEDEHKMWQDICSTYGQGFVPITLLQEKKVRFVIASACSPVEVSFKSCVLVCRNCVW
jgi:hypothetical protein